MMKKLQHIFALTEQGAKDLVKAVIWCFICNISLMIPVGVVMWVIMHLTDVLEYGGDPMEHFWLYTLSGVAVVVLLFILHYFQYASLYLATYKESANRRIGLAETLRKLPLSFFGNRDLSDLTSTMIADCSALDQMFSHYIPQLFASIFSTVVIGILMFLCDWRMALSVLWVLPVAVLLTAGSKKLQDAFGTKNILTKRAVAEHIQEGLETVRDIRACSRQDTYLAELDEKLSDMERSSIHSELATGVFVCSAQAFLRVGLATTVLTGSSLMVAGDLDFLFFLGFLFAAARLYDPLGMVLQNIAATFSAKLKIERMRAIQEQPVQEGSEEFHPKNFDITFDHVRFSYHDGEGVLDDVSFTAKQGEVTALIGPSGGGKSTACKLAARFWDVNGGRITLGGTDISGIDPETLLTHYAMVFQDVVLFRDTVMENIRLGRRNATDEEVLAAARAAQCDEFIRRLPDGYQTVIGENGSTLSGGERQRISIARALLKDAPVILLDEATASLDVENESAVQAALSRLIRNKTVLIIAHRMRTVAGADHIVVLDGGKVAQQGTPEELMKEGGLYRRMSELQQQTAAWTLGRKGSELINSRR
ncbi:MAG TPA: ABC transporter ATP-binding protein/permease [Candidatus Mediterraneibacter cottocaccae]|nr:ABC transporter ATP-binding protein/permease [Candidatus Mediterraneibacter cottocaccae]